MEIINVDPGEKVVCDYCDKDYTNINESGGFLFGSYAVCPTCALGMMQKIRKYNETHLIKAICPPELSFRDWVYTLRARR